MRILKNYVTNSQIYFMLIMTLTTVAALNLPKVAAESAGRGGWVPIIITSIFFAFFVTIITSLNNMHQGKPLFDYSQKIVGKFLGKAIAVFYLIYFFNIMIFLKVQLTHFLKSDFLLKTPTWATLLVGIPIFCAIAYKGITGIARFFQVIAVFYILAALFVHITMLTQGVKHEIFPLFRASEIPRYIPATKDIVFSFLGIEILTYIPFSHKNGKKASASAFAAVLSVGIFYALIVISSISVMGVDNIQYYNFAMTEAIKIVDNPLFERFDFLYLTIGLSGLIGGLSVVYLSTAEYACKLFPGVKRIVIVIIIGILVAALTLTAMRIKTYTKIFDELVVYAGLVAAVIIPSLLYLIAKVRSRAKKTY